MLMPEDKKSDNKLDLEIDNISFEESPLKFCQHIYSESLNRYEDLEPINIENRLFYEGQDKNLDERKNNTRVVRSSIFIPLLTPAIDTRCGDVISRLEEREFPVRFTSSTKKPTDIEKDQADWIEKTITGQMRDCGYLTDIFKEHMLAAEMYRTPAAVKVGWENGTKRVAELSEPSLFEQARALATGKQIKPKVRFVNKDIGRPYVEYLYPEEFLYQPYISMFQEDSTYAMHALWLPYNELEVRAKELNYDLDKIRQFRDDVNNTESSKSGESHESERDKVADEKEVPYDDGYRDGKFLLVENYILTYSDDGDEVIRLVVTVGNKHIVYNRKTPFQGIRFPFVTLVANRLPGTIEGMSSIDRGKFLQRLYNEIFNSYLDGVTYRIFPPFKAGVGMSFEKEPIYGPAQIWRVNDPEQLQPVIQNPGMLPDLPSLMGAVDAKLRNTLNAEDTSQGFNAQQYEKATATKLRAVGSSRRATPTHKRYGESIIAIAEMFLALNQQFHEEKERFVMDLTIDVPSLTNVSDPESDKQDAILLLSTAEQSPQYQSPIGQQKIRNMWEDLVRMFKKVNVDDYVITEEEFSEQQRIESETQSALIDKQSTTEQLTLEQENAPQQQS